MSGGEREGTREAERASDEALLRRAMPELQAEQEAGRPQPERPEEREGEEDGPAPRIYVASLSDYNAGRLHGRWIDANQPLDDLWSEIHDILAESPEPGAEEWAIHDYEGFGPLVLHEYESLELVRDVAAGITEHGEAFAAFVEVAERDVERLPLFEQLYRGMWESPEAYAEHLLESLGVEAELEQLPEWVRPYVSIDVAALVNELESAGAVWAVPAREGGVYVFDFE